MSLLGVFTFIAYATLAQRSETINPVAVLLPGSPQVDVVAKQSSVSNEKQYDSKVTAVIVAATAPPPLRP